jgi:hypothetical protein
MRKRHKEWYSRGYLPHFDHVGLIQVVTFRLVDALPTDLLEKLEKAVSKENDVEKRKRIEAWLDAGYGSCWLRDPRIAAIVEEALLHFDAHRYRLLAWAIMPNHVHALVELSRRYCFLTLCTLGSPLPLRQPTEFFIDPAHSGCRSTLTGTSATRGTLPMPSTIFIRIP